MRLAIHKNDKIFNHYILWTNEWINYCEVNKVSYKVVNCYDYDILDQLKEFNALVFHIVNYVYQDMFFARSILHSAKKMGLSVFPDFNDAWHFDDKIAETYALQSAGAPIPKSWMFYTFDDLLKWADGFIELPVVAKLRTGSGSHNVVLIKSKSQLISYAKQMFSNGLSPVPNIGFKASSQLNSSKNMGDIVKRLKKLPFFLHTLSRAKQFPREKNYVYLQEFIPNNGFDLKVVAVNDKVSYLCRNTRKGEFRASGGGDLFYDKRLVTEDIIKSAFKTNKKLGFQCMGYDYVVDKRTNKGVIVEMSYGFSHEAILQAKGHWNREMKWIGEPLSAPAEILKNMLK
ncbi:MAG: hypothetical protein JW976_05590 [Syntrophaceae bacterium]|nr:hypothetical protein [Syntrophaceae bacterium]